MRENCIRNSQPKLYYIAFASASKCKLYGYRLWLAPFLSRFVQHKVEKIKSESLPFNDIHFPVLRVL